MFKFLKNASIPAMLAIAGGAGMSVAFSGLVYRRACEKTLKDSDFLSDAVKEMGKHDEIINILGGKYEVCPINHQDGWTEVGESQMRICLPIKGEKRNANLLIFANKNNKERVLELFRIEMVFDKIDSKRLLILDRPEILKKPSEKNKELMFIKK